MNLRLIQFGKSKDKWLIEAVSEYQKRLQAFCKLEIVELADESLKTNSGIEQVKQKEAQSCLSKIESNDYLVLLDETGEMKSSLEFSGFLTNISENKRVVFVIGGVYGTAAILKERANQVFSLSRLTFTTGWRD